MVVGSINDTISLGGYSSQSIISIMSLLEDCVCSSVCEAINSGEHTVVADIGIGTLSILFIDNEMSYKFIPSQSFENKLVGSVDGKNPLIERAEKRVVSSILSSYKELL